MMIPVSFRGLSGRAWTFNRVETDAPWAGSAGVAIFAAPDSYGWRVIKVAHLKGRRDDIQPVWAFAEAERFGATAVFIAAELDEKRRRLIIADIEMGLSPVCESYMGIAA